MKEEKSDSHESREINAAQERFAKFKQSAAVLNEEARKLLFTEARSQNGWLDRPVTEEILREVYSLAKMGATSMNGSPAHFAFINSDQGKERLRPTILPFNLDKVMTAPVVCIVASDYEFYRKLDKLFPDSPGADSLFKNDEDLAQVTAFRNGTLQGAYLMLAARAVGLDCGPMSGFNNAAVDEEFFGGTKLKSNFLCCLGYGDHKKISYRFPRLEFEEACELI